MGLMEDIQHEQTLVRGGGRLCWFTTLSDEHQRDVSEAIRLGIAGTAISRALTKNGIDISPSRVRVHMRGDCKCRS